MSLFSISTALGEVHPFPAPNSGLTPGSSTHCHVLLVEDDELIGAAVSIFLRGKGHTVEHFMSAVHARTWLARNPCDLVITDIYMPDCDGLEVIQWVRSKHPGIKIIAMSGSDTFGHSPLRAAELMGAARVLQKPFELTALADVVDDVMQQRK